MTPAPQRNGRVAVVTGAFGFTGRYIARKLLASGWRVRTLIGHRPDEDPFEGAVEIHGLDFSSPERVAAILRGADALINTYWVRFRHGQLGFEAAIENSRTLIRAARAAGVPRIVHLSVSNPALDSPFAYFRGKAQVEQSIVESGLSYAILRPALIFGREDILLNNIAWFVRRFPVFLLPGRGEYRLRPIFVGDLAELAVTAASQTENCILDAVGPETLTFRETVDQLRDAASSAARVVSAPALLARAAARCLGFVLRDVVLTDEEIGALMAGLLDSPAPSTGQTSLRAWIRENAAMLGQCYASELARHFRRAPAIPGLETIPRRCLC